MFGWTTDPTVVSQHQKPAEPLVSLWTSTFLDSGIYIVLELWTLQRHWWVASNATYYRLTSFCRESRQCFHIVLVKVEETCCRYHSHTVENAENVKHLVDCRRVAWCLMYCPLSITTIAFDIVSAVLLWRCRCVSDMIK